MSRNTKIEQAKLSADRKYKEQVDFQHTLRNILKFSKKFEDAFLDLSTNGNTFANELSNLSRKEYIVQSPQLSQFLFHYGSTMGNLSSVRNQMVDQLRCEFDDFVSQFVDYDFLELSDTKAKMDHAVATYDTKLTTIDELGKKGKLDEQKLAQCEVDLDTARKAVDTTTADFYKALEYVDDNKEWKLLRYMYQHMEMQANYFQLAQKLYSTTLVKMDAVKKHLEYLDSNSSHRHTVEGYLLKKGNKLSGGDKRYWFILKDGHLTMLKGKKASTPLDMRLCTVRSMPQSLAKKDKQEGGANSPNNNPHNSNNEKQPPTPLQLSFEIVSHNKKPLILQAQTMTEKDTWVKALTNSISTSLNNSNFLDAPAKAASQDSAARAFSILRKVPGNCICVDCDAKDPDWASINLGVTVCLECSGVHRSLGVHISKVRSLTLDKWDPELVFYMKRAGNDLVNSIYEYGLASSGYDKPTRKTDREAREAYIKAKYVSKIFLPPPSSSHYQDRDRDEANLNLVRSNSDNVHELLLHIAQGADVNYVAHEAASLGNTLLYTCLVQNGAAPFSGVFHSNLTLDDLENDREGTIVATVHAPASATAESTQRKTATESYEESPGPPRARKITLGSAAALQRSMSQSAGQMQAPVLVKQSSASNLTTHVTSPEGSTPHGPSPLSASQNGITKTITPKKPLPSTPPVPGAAAVGPGTPTHKPPPAAAGGAASPRIPPSVPAAAKPPIPQPHHLHPPSPHLHPPSHHLQPPPPSQQPNSPQLQPQQPQTPAQQLGAMLSKGPPSRPPAAVPRAKPQPPPKPV